MGRPHTRYSHWVVNRCVGGGLIVARTPASCLGGWRPRHKAAICAAPPPAQHSFVRDILLLCGQLWRIIQLEQISTGKISARRPQLSIFSPHNGGRRRVGGLAPVTTNTTFNQNIISWLPMFIFIENICTRPRVEYLPGCSLTV